MNEEQLSSREVDFIDITNDEISTKHYRVEEDLTTWKSVKKNRGPLPSDWMKSETNEKPMMCSYKYVTVSFEVWGLQTRVEDYVQRVIREVLLVGHRQAVAWLDQWIDMTEADVRVYEKQVFHETNNKIRSDEQQSSQLETETCVENVEADAGKADPNSTPKRGWFGWT